MASTEGFLIDSETSFSDEFYLDSKLLIDPRLLFVGPKIGEGAHAKVYEGKPETMEEKTLKDEISQLKEKLPTDAHVQLNGEDSGGLQTLQDLVVKKERELELLIQELDDKVRFGQRGSDRPGSGASRTGVGYLERPSSQSGASEDSRSVEFAERPHSRGSAPDVWTRNDNGRGFRGTKERGFPVNRDADRLRSKERW